MAQLAAVLPAMMAKGAAMMTVASPYIQAGATLASAARAAAGSGGPKIKQAPAPNESALRLNRRRDLARQRTGMGRSSTLLSDGETLGS